MIKLKIINKDEFLKKKFYKIRFKKDLLDNFVNQKKYSYKSYNTWFEKNLINILIYEINFKNKEVGIIYFNKKTSKYFIFIDKNFQKKGFGYLAIIKYLKLNRNKKIKTDILKKNLISLNIHLKLEPKKIIIKKKYYQFVF